MMHWLLLQHLATVSALILIVFFVGRVARPIPAIRHGLWLVVLWKLMFPPIVIWPWSTTQIVRAVNGPPVVTAQQPVGNESTATAQPSATSGPRDNAPRYLAHVWPSDQAVTETLATDHTELPRLE